MKRLTDKMLLKAGAEADCAALALFRETFPRGSTLTAKSLRKAMDAGLDVAWAVKYIPAVRKLPGLCRLLCEGLKSDADSWVRGECAWALGQLGDPAALLMAARQQVSCYTLAPSGGVRVVLSALGGLAGCVGAARLVLGPGVS